MIQPLDDLIWCEQWRAVAPPWAVTAADGALSGDPLDAADVLEALAAAAR